MVSIVEAGQRSGQRTAVLESPVSSATTPDVLACIEATRARVIVGECSLPQATGSSRTECPLLRNESNSFPAVAQLRDGIKSMPTGAPRAAQCVAHGRNSLHAPRNASWALAQAFPKREVASSS